MIKIYRENFGKCWHKSVAGTLTLEEPVIQIHVWQYYNSLPDGLEFPTTLL